MYKQVLRGIERPAIFGVLIFMVSLLFISTLEAVWKTPIATVLFYVVASVVYACICTFLWIITYVKYEYALLDTELIVRKYVAKRAIRIFSIKLTRSNCVYYNKYDRFFAPILHHTYNMYLPVTGFFGKTAVIIFADQDGKRKKIVFKPDEKLDQDIHNIKTMKV